MPRNYALIPHSSKESFIERNSAMTDMHVKYGTRVDGSPAIDLMIGDDAFKVSPRCAYTGIAGVEHNGKKYIAVGEFHQDHEVLKPGVVYTITEA